MLRRHQRRNNAAGRGPCLGSMPHVVLELICGSLPFIDRVALASCCRELWTRPVVTSSPALWGVVQAKGSQLSASLAAWLARRKAAVCRLKISDVFASPAAVLAAVKGGAVAALEVRNCTDMESRSISNEELGPLAELGGTLTELVLADFRTNCVPPQLSVLTALKTLELDGAWRWFAAGEAGYTSLAVSTQLTALRLTNCSLWELPQLLPALASSLKVLGLAINPGLWHEGAASLHMISKLTALTSLDMMYCGLPHIPTQLSALSCLQHLNLCGNRMGTTAAASGFEPLRSLARLTSLDLRSCHLTLLPPQLSCLSALAHLKLRYNHDLGHLLAGGAAPPGRPAVAVASRWQPLVSLGASLTHLDLIYDNIVALPTDFSSLCGLKELLLSSNDLGSMEGDGAALRPLSGLTALTFLQLDSCKLSCVPMQLRRLPTLRVLHLGGNLTLGMLGQELVQQLMGLTALTHLNLCDCNVLHPSVITPLVVRGVCVQLQSSLCLTG